VTLEASLGELEAVQQRLAENERQIKGQIDDLTEDLKANQDPGRMQLIQEMISVRPFTASISHE
jgi:ferritin